MAPIPTCLISSYMKNEQFSVVSSSDVFNFPTSGVVQLFLKYAQLYDLFTSYMVHVVNWSLLKF